METPKQRVTAHSVTLDSPAVIQKVSPLLAATLIIKKARQTPRFVARIEAALRRSLAMRHK
jgi:hypothetical protein